MPLFRRPSVLVPAPAPGALPAFSRMGKAGGEAAGTGILPPDSKTPRQDTKALRDASRDWSRNLRGFARLPLPVARAGVLVP